ncbi:DUF1971 domain-containing protein [Blastomonas sp. CCH8-A3]|uniref:DUF1971 domain-containing protein n=1 Tax=Blastomonas sp. CCH8-A3 TaxID=1768743 RepID=UPI000AF8F1FD|nr:DUF1971 domain-containing protein [Blastomonas sp. CCH8-A3]
MISIVNTECHVPKTFSDLAKIAAWGRLGLEGEVRLIFTEPHREVLVTPDMPAPIAPLATHYVVPLGKMTMQVEFYRSEPVLDVDQMTEPSGG